MPCGKPEFRRRPGRPMSARAGLLAKAGRRMEIGGLAGDPAEKLLQIGEGGRRAVFGVEAGQFHICEGRVESSVADGVDRHRRPAAAAFGAGMMPFDPSSERSTAQPAGIGRHHRLGPAFCQVLAVPAGGSRPALRTTSCSAGCGVSADCGPHSFWLPGMYKGGAEVGSKPMSHAARRRAQSTVPQRKRRPSTVYPWFDACDRHREAELAANSPRPFHSVSARRRRKRSDCPTSPAVLDRARIVRAQSDMHAF